MDGCGTPPAVCISGARRHDAMLFAAVLDALPPVAGLGERAGAPTAWTRRGVVVRIAHRGIKSREQRGRHRWVVERTHAWLAGFGKLRIRFERRLETPLALSRLACASICLRAVKS